MKKLKQKQCQSGSKEFCWTDSYFGMNILSIFKTKLLKA